MIDRMAALHLILDEAIDNLRGVRQRTFLSLVGIAVGAASVVALINVGENAAAESTRQFRAMGTDILVVQNGIALQGSRPIGISDIRSVAPAISAAAIATPFSTTSVKVWLHGKSVDTTAVGAMPELAELARLQTGSGRFISEFDGHETFAVIGRGLANTLSTPAAPVRIGEKIRIDDYLFTIVGILDASARNPLVPVDFNESVMVSMKSVRRALASNSEISGALVKVRGDADPVAVAAQVADYLRAKTANNGIQVQSAEQLIEGLRKQNRLFTFLLGGIGAISLVVGGIGIMNVMLAGIAERQREIGVRMAIGARRHDVLTMILLEASLLSVIGGCCGTLLGLVAAYLFAIISGWEFSFSVLSLPIGLGMSLLVGLFFGVYPALKASRMSPIEALRAE
ncbi:MAG TPA: ABC transporter permease [Gallionella sp.]|nr:ABC transporter permease [Gallionella sp.]